MLERVRRARERNGLVECLCQANKARRVATIVADRGKDSLQLDLTVVSYAAG